MRHGGEQTATERGFVADCIRTESRMNELKHKEIIVIRESMKNRGDEMGKTRPSAMRLFVA